MDQPLDASQHPLSWLSLPDTIADRLRLEPTGRTLLIADANCLKQSGATLGMETGSSAARFVVLESEHFERDMLAQLSGSEKVGRSFPLDRETGSFDRIVCAHLFAGMADIEAALVEFGRLLSSDGLLLLVEYLVPGSHLRGKEARKLNAAGDYVNAWTTLRSPQHRQYLSESAWNQSLWSAGWDVAAFEQRSIPETFESWIGGRPISTANRTRLKAMLMQAPEKVLAFLTPSFSGDRIDFHVVQGIILASKEVPQ